ncbi:SMP-30/gluconolactonase/LRE family protein [Nocardia grenadensis]
MSAVGEWTALGTARHELGEGARATVSGFLFVDLLAGVLLETDGTPFPGTEDDPTHPAREVLRLDVPLGAVAPRMGGGWIAAAGTGIALLDVWDRAGSSAPAVEIEWLARPFDDAPVPMRMNDGVADPRGRFWAGAMPYDGTPGAGRLVRVDPDGNVQVVLDGLTIPNGPVFSPDGAIMYLADSARGVILRYRVKADGGIDEPAVFATVDDASPDGMTVDADGCVWSALWGGRRLHRYSPDGELIDVAPVPVTQPTSIAVGAGAPHRIVVTTATHGLTEPGPLDGATLVASTTIAGLPTATFGA